MELWLSNLLALFSDPILDEIILNGPERMALVSRHRTETRKGPFASPLQMLDYMQDFAFEQGLRLDPFEPAAGGLVQGFRWHCAIAPLTPSGPVLSLRRHRFDCLNTLNFAASEDLRTKLKALILSGTNILICGATGSGKTTLLAQILQTYARSERVIILEELKELPELGTQWISLLTRASDLEGNGLITMPYLLKQSLRLRPDRLVIGEIRGDEAKVFFEATLTGHRGCLATIHGSSTDSIRKRLRWMLAEMAEQTAEIWCVSLQSSPTPTITTIERL